MSAQAPLEQDPVPPALEKEGSRPAARPGTAEPSARLRIGELSRRTGVAPDTLRAWERRYGVLQPIRSEGGFRLYSFEDLERVRAMKTMIDAGVWASDAAHLVAGDGPTAPPTSADELVPRLRGALESFDDAAANAILDEAVLALSVEGLASRVLLPVMAEIGDRWECGEATVAQEHFATGVVRGRLLGLARNWGAGSGPRAVLACPPGELHDLGLIVFGIGLRARGWRITYLGPDTPPETIREAAAGLDASLVVIAGTEPSRLEAAVAEIGPRLGDVPVVIGGPGARPETSDSTGARLLSQDPVEAAALVARGGFGVRA